MVHKTRLFLLFTLRKPFEDPSAYEHDENADLKRPSPLLESDGGGRCWNSCKCLLFSPHFVSRSYFCDRNSESFGSSSSHQHAFSPWLAFFVDFIDRSRLAALHQPWIIFSTHVKMSSCCPIAVLQCILSSTALEFHSAALPHCRRHHVELHTLPRDGCTEAEKMKGNIASRNWHRNGSSHASFHQYDYARFRTNNF